MKIKEFIKENIEETVTSVKLLKEQPLHSLGQILPVAMILLSILGFLIALIKFITQGGFSSQLSSLNNDFFQGVIEGFSLGTVNILTSGIIPSLILSIAIGEIIIIIISYFRTENRNKRILVGACSGIAVFFIGTAGFILAVGFGKLRLSEAMTLKIYEFVSIFNGIPSSLFIMILNILTFVGLVCLAVSAVLVIRSEHKWMFKNTATALFVNFICLPLVLLILENIIPMSISLIALVVLGGLLLLFGEIFFFGSGQDSKGTGNSYTDKASSLSKSKESLAVKKEEAKQPKQWKIDRNAQLWVEMNMTGGKVIRAYGQGPFSNEYNVPITYKLIEDPSLDEFLKGKIIITVQGRTMTENDLHYNLKL